MARSTQEQLDSVDALIAELEARRAASHTTKDLEVVDKQLQPLYEREERLRLRLSEENASSGGMSSVGRIGRPA